MIFDTIDSIAPLNEQYYCLEDPITLSHLWGYAQGTPDRQYKVVKDLFDNRRKEFFSMYDIKSITASIKKDLDKRINMKNKSKTLMDPVDFVDLDNYYHLKLRLCEMGGREKFFKEYSRYEFYELFTFPFAYFCFEDKSAVPITLLIDKYICCFTFNYDKIVEGFYFASPNIHELITSACYWGTLSESIKYDKIKPKKKKK